MPEQPEDLCPRPPRPLPSVGTPLSPALHLSSVYQCRDPDEADALCAGQQPGYVYRRDAQPNADLLADKLRALHGAEQGAVCGSGMGALAAVVLAHLEQGDRLLASRELYGRSQRLLCQDLPRFGVATAQVDPHDLSALRSALEDRPKLLVVETISNPLLRVADISALAALCREFGTLLVVDNTFAGPVIFRPLEWGADLVIESLTKSAGGHSDVVLGWVCGSSAAWGRLAETLVTWGLGPAAFDAWLAGRGMATWALRIERAASNALAAARFLAGQPGIARVIYPGLKDHPEHALAVRQFGDRTGAIVSFELQGGRAAASRFIRAATEIPFCPSLGEVSTTLSHPESTSHRGLSAIERGELGISGGVIRLSVGIESPTAICAALAQGLSALSPESPR